MQVILYMYKISVKPADSRYKKASYLGHSIGKLNHCIVLNRNDQVWPLQPPACICRLNNDLLIPSL